MGGVCVCVCVGGGGGGGGGAFKIYVQEELQGDVCEPAKQNCKIVQAFD